MPRILRYPGGVIQSRSSDSIVLIPDIMPKLEDSHLPEGDDGEFKELTAEDYKQAAYYVKETAEKEANELLQRTNGEIAVLLSKAKAEAEAILMAARREAEMVLIQAKATGERDGYEAAFLQQTNDIMACLSQSAKAIEEAKTAQEEYMSSCEAEVGKLSLEIASEILQHDIDVDPLALCDLVERAVGSLKDTKWVVLSLSKKLIPLIELLQSELPAKCPTIGHLEIIGKDLSDGSCVIDSVDGLVDASVETQIKTLERRFAQATQKLKGG